jgi:hypothetical protein
VLNSGSRRPAGGSSTNSSSSSSTAMSGLTEGCFAALCIASGGSCLLCQTGLGEEVECTGSCCAVKLGWSLMDASSMDDCA